MATDIKEQGLDPKVIRKGSAMVLTRVLCKVPVVSTTDAWPSCVLQQARQPCLLR